MAWNFLQGDKKPGGGVLGFLRKNVVEPTVNPVFKFLNEPVALGQAATGNLKGAKKTLSPGGGLGHQGGVLGGEELSREAVLLKPKNIKRVTGTGVSIGSNLVAPGAGGAGASLGVRVAKGAAVGAGLGAVSSAGEQLANGDVFDPRRLIGGALFGAALGGGTPIAGAAGRDIAKNALLETGAVGPGAGDLARKQGLQRLAKATTPQQVKQIMKGTPQEIIDKVASAIVQTKDPHIIDNIIQKAYQPPAPAAVPTPAVAQAPQDLVAATVPKPPITAAPDPFNEITDALNGKVQQATATNRKLLTQERGQRFAASKSAGATAEGSQGYFKELSQLKGSYSKTKLGGMIENLGPDKAEDLFTQARAKVLSIPDNVYDDLGYFPQSARLNTQTALRKVIFGEGGGVPTQSELKLLRVAAPDLAADIESKIPKSRKIFDLAAKIAGLPRALQSSFDLSMGGRQGLLVAARHPVLWARANKESVKYLAKPKYFDSQMAAIRKTPEYALGEKYGLATPAANKGAEEAYASADLAEAIPGVGKGVQASQRAYDGGLTKLRSDLWAQTLDAYGGAAGAEAELGKQGMQDLAEAVNTLTGRGGKKGGLIEKHVQTLSTTLFAPRLWAARLNTLNPQYYARLSPAARKVALENAAAFAGVASVVLGAAVAIGAEVETDARSSDFLKIKFGDTRYDIFGGLQQNIVFAWRQVSGEKKSSQNGEVTKLGDGYGAPTRLSVASDLVSNKLAPLPAFGAKVLEGKDRTGQDVNVAAELGKLFVPINLQGIYETSKSTGSVPEGVAKNIPNFFGVGTQTYGTQDINLSDRQKAAVKVLEQKGAPKEQVSAAKLFYQTLKTAPKRDKASDKVNEALAAGDTQKAIDIAKEYNQRYADSFKKWAEQYGDYANDETLLEEYNAGKIKMTASNIKRRLANIKDNPTYQVKE